MTSEFAMMAPICLVENKEEQLTMNPEALQILHKISQPVVVVAIAGMYRTGKSYLMNCLAGQNHGFPLGSTVRCETKGIWMWCVPHPSKPNHTLVLLDTEGLDDVRKVDPKNDLWIFTLAVLLSSTFVYNSMSTISHQALEQLHYVTELTKLIRAKSSSTPGEVEDSTNFVSFFPDFVWTVRDFALELKIDEHPITEDEYLEDALKLIPGKNSKCIQNFNILRECIKHLFPKRKCFVFDRPLSDKNLLFHMETVSEDQLEGNFHMQSKSFCSYIFTHAKVKTLTEGIIVTGKRLGNLVETFTDAIKRGTVLCLENTVTTLVQQDSTVAMQKEVDHYSEQVAEQLRLPMDMPQELLDMHITCKRGAVGVIVEHSLKDNPWEFQKNLMASEVQKTFLQSQAAIKESILQADKALTAEKALAADQAKKETAEKEQELLRQKLQEQQQHMETQERIFKENIVQLKSMEWEIKNLLRDWERVLEHKLKLQEELLNEVFQKICEELHAEIHQLKKEIETTKRHRWLLTSKIIDVAGNVLIAELPGAAKLFGVGLKVISSLIE